MAHTASPKKVVYVGAFVVLGLLLQQVVHAGLEMAMINLLLTDFEAYGLGLTWKDWVVIHNVGSVILILAGLAFGWWQGNYWWRILYVEKRPIFKHWLTKKTSKSKKRKKR